MQTLNTIHIRSDIDTVFNLAADIEQWPRLLPHYRWVRTLWTDERDTCVVEMAARRGIIPVKWTSVQYRSRCDCHIYYRHVDGPTAGMWVDWCLESAGDGVDVGIVHDLCLTRPIVSSGVGIWVVAEMFVKSIADRTLVTIKALAEGSR